MDDDKPRRSWREIDANKDRSYHRKDSSSGGNRRASKRQNYESKRYKSELDKIFSGDGLPEHLAQQLAESEGQGTSARERLTLLRTIKEAVDPDEVLNTITQLYNLDNELPETELVLVPAVEHPDEDISLHAMHKLNDLIKVSPLKRKALLKTKLQGIAGIHDDPQISNAAEELLKLL